MFDINLTYLLLMFPIAELISCTPTQHSVAVKILGRPASKQYTLKNSIMSMSGPTRLTSWPLVAIKAKRIRYYA